MDRKRREESAIKDRIKEKQNEKSEGMERAVLTRLHLSASALKYLALLAMTADHIAVICRPVPGFRTFGDLAVPLFAFLLVEGFFHTSNRKKYALRLGIFALVSEVPFDLAFRSSILEFTYQNVMVTLFIGFLTIWAMEVLRRKNPAWMAVAAGLGVLTGYLARSDYGWKGIILILIFYLFYYQPVEKTIAGCLALLWEAPACFAFL